MRGWIPAVDGSKSLFKTAKSAAARSRSRSILEEMKWNISRPFPKGSKGRFAAAYFAHRRIRWVRGSPSFSALIFPLFPGFIKKEFLL